MTTYQWLCLLGVPSLLIAALLAMIRHLAAQILQARLRAKMISDYNKWTDRGYAPIYARQNFENCWGHYHTLGANGVMDDIHEKFLQLPTQEK